MTPDNLDPEPAFNDRARDAEDFRQRVDAVLEWAISSGFPTAHDARGSGNPVLSQLPSNRRGGEVQLHPTRSEARDGRIRNPDRPARETARGGGRVGPDGSRDPSRSTVETVFCRPRADAESE